MFKTIMVPVDWTTLSEHAVLTAISISKIHGAKLVLLSVAKPRLFHSGEADAVRDGEQIEAANRALARECVAKFAALAMEHEFACEAVVSQSAFVSTEMINVAARYGCDAIFMATRAKMGGAGYDFRWKRDPARTAGNHGTGFGHSGVELELS